jgi:broad specificity phosphatase PhoE
VLDRVASADGDVLCFGHGHASRVLVATALLLEPLAGARFALDPARVGIVGSEHDEPALRQWNPPPG